MAIFLKYKDTNIFLSVEKFIIGTLSTELNDSVGTSMALRSLSEPLFNFHFSICIGPSANTLFNFQL